MAFLLSKHDVLMNGVKYLHKNGKLFTFCDDGVYGPEADSDSQRLFDESFIKEMLAPLRTASGQRSYSKKSQNYAKTLIQWLKENPDHSQYEKILRELISYHPSIWSSLVSESIALLPPQPYSPRIHYDTDLVQYTQAYLANPQRPPTHEEIVEMLVHTVSHTSYPTRVFPALNAAGFTPDHIPSKRTLNGIPYSDHVNRYLTNTCEDECSVKCLKTKDIADHASQGKSSVFCPFHGRFVKI